MRNIAGRTVLFTLATAIATQLMLGEVKIRDVAQPIDDEYTQKIREYTTESFFNSPWTDYLPASTSVPTPKAVLGDIAGAPNKLPYSADVYRYMRMLERATPRVKVFSIGTTEEGREMIAVAVASEKLMADLDQNRTRLTQLADPRLINMDDGRAEQLIESSVPIYYITGSIHAPETGAPTALMELAYRLAVDESPRIRGIRDRLVTLITPVVEVDGRDREVDIYNWHLAHPGQNWPNLVYWGKYVAHDNNRDAMGLTLKLTRNVLQTYLTWRPQVLHDLHESVPYLYDNTIGDEPYNAWLDPILTDEWQIIGSHNVSEMTKLGMPGVFAHGDFDTWSPGYLMFIAASHNGISRLYETFGNSGADTIERTLTPQQYERTWYRQNPPLPKAKWSQRDNNNFEQTGLLISLDHFAENSKVFLHNFYLKSKRSIEKPKNEGPAAYVFSSDDPRPGGQAELLRLLQLQGCEVVQATSEFSVTMPKPKTDKDKADKDKADKDKKEPATETVQFPAGSYLVRMDQPYSRIADMILDYQYWSPNDPQRRPYDDTAWTFGEFGNVKVARVSEIKVLDVPVKRIAARVTAAGGIHGDGNVFLVNHNSDNALVTLRYKLRNARMDAAEEPFEFQGTKFNRGSFIIRDITAEELRSATSSLGLQAFASTDTPAVVTHPVRMARVALVHTWLTTQDEGWWRHALEDANVPFTYMSTQAVARDPNLRSKYDVVVFPPAGRNTPQAIVAGMPLWGNPLPWKKTPETPNIGSPDSTDDMRPGLSLIGVENLKNFVEQGGVLLTSMNTADMAITFGLAPGVSIAPKQKFKATGTALRTKIVDPTSPLAYGYNDNLAVYCFECTIYNLSNLSNGGGQRPATEPERMTGRGTKDDPDLPQGRRAVELPEIPKAEPWEALPLTDEQKRNNPAVIPPEFRPRVVLRYADSKELFVSGLLDGASEIAQHPAVVDIPMSRGHVVLFSNNPIWRGETSGSHFLVYNAILNFDNINAGRKK
ncbi:MAG TPA: M14 family zinc carboxypeptidase [Terriglobia bacterium]|nr:M14 family zinc carboxypeptidase [Terriglobia bacterium]